MGARYPRGVSAPRQLGAPTDEDGSGEDAPVTASVDTKVVIRHLTVASPKVAARATPHPPT